MDTFSTNCLEGQLKLGDQSYFSSISITKPTFAARLLHQNRASVGVN